MRITADTNILISATFWRGESDQIIRRIQTKEIELILLKEIIREFAEVLNYEEIKNKIKDKNLEMQRTVEKIFQISTIVELKDRIDVIKEDTSDNNFLECAISGKADYIISNYKKHLLKLKEF